MWAGQLSKKITTSSLSIPLLFTTSVITASLNFTKLNWFRPPFRNWDKTTPSLDIARTKEVFFIYFILCFIFCSPFFEYAIYLKLVLLIPVSSIQIMYLFYIIWLANMWNESHSRVSLIFWSSISYDRK